MQYSRENAADVMLRNICLLSSCVKTLVNRKLYEVTQMLMMVGYVGMMAVQKSYNHGSIWIV